MEEKVDQGIIGSKDKVTRDSISQQMKNIQILAH